MSDVIVGSNGFSSGFSSGFEISGLGILTITTTLPEASATIQTNLVYPPTLSATFTTLPVTVKAQLGDFFSCRPFNTNSFFQKDNECSDGERELYDVLQMEAWNSFGVNMVYYVTDYTKSNEPIFGEDNDRTVLRTFDSTGFMDQLPREDRNVPQFGIEGLDLFKLYLNKLHFEVASTYADSQSAIYDAYRPQTGDIIHLDYNDIFYEVTHVKDKVEQFLQRSHAWDLSLREYKDVHLTLSSEVSSSDLSAYVDQNDYLEQNQDIDNEKSVILYTSGVAEEPSQDPFASW